LTTADPTSTVGASIPGVRAGTAAVVLPVVAVVVSVFEKTGAVVPITRLLARVDAINKLRFIAKEEIVY